jgi:hypothetical protein
MHSPLKSYSVQQSRDFANWFRFEVRDGDQFEEDVGRPTFYNRAELYAAGTTIDGDEETWFSFAVRAFGVSDFNNARAIFQGVYTIPVLQILCQDTSFRIRTFEDVEGTATSVTRYVGDPMVEGEPEQIVMRCKFSPTAAELQVWRNGSEILNLSGIKMGDGPTTIPKFGIYRSGASETFVTEVANWEFGQASLADRVLNPLALPPGW